MSTSFDWDVFLSQSSVDKPRVARLAERLTAAGFRVRFDRPAIDIGENIITTIEQGLERNTAKFRDPGNHAQSFSFPTVRS